MAGGLLNQAQQAMPPAPTAPALAQSAAAAGAPGPQQAAPAGAPPPGPAAAPPPGAAPPPAGGMPANPMPDGPQRGAGTPAQGGRATGGMDIEMEQATPEEQKEYERAMAALSKTLYSNKKLSNSIVDQIDPNDKVSSTSKVSMLFIKSLDEKVNLDEIVIADITEESVTRIMELAENRHQIQYDDRELQMILGSTWEGIQQLFGMDEEGHAEFVNSIGSDKLPELKQQYEAALRG